MKILILANSAGGLLHFRRELLERLVADGHEVVVDLPLDELLKELLGLGVGCIVNTNLSRHGTNPLQDVLLLKHYLSVIRKERAEMVLTYTIKANVYGGIACQMLHVPYVSNVTGLGIVIENKGLLQSVTLQLYCLGLRKAQKVFFQNEANRDFMLSHKVVDDRSEVLPGSGVNTDKFYLQEYPGEDEPIRFITVGRIMRDKGTGELLEAARAVKQTYPSVVFCLLGYFDEDWQKAVEDAVDEGVIEYVSRQPDVRPYVAKSHALVHPSWHEGMSNVCLEAASMGRPVLASDVPGCRETFDDGVSGISFTARNALSLAGTIESFIQMPWSEKRAMGLAGREKVVHQFDRQIVVDKYLAEIEAVSKE